MTKIKSYQRNQFLYNISKLYYIEKVSQDELAKVYKVSRATISRGLKEAEENKIVEIHIRDVSGIREKLEEKIKDKYKIKDVVVSIVPNNDEKLVKRLIGRDAANLIGKLIKDNMSVGVAWGTTLYELVNFLEPRPLKNVKVLDLIGSLGKLFSNIDASELARRFSKNYSAINYFLNSLAVVNSKEARYHLTREKEIKDVLEMQKNLDLVIISIGTVSLKSSILKNLKFRKEILKDIKAKGAVGDICLRFFDKSGNKIKTSFDDRIIGIDLEDFKKIKVKFCVSGGLEKLEAIRCALNSKLLDILITDSSVAENL